MSETLENLVRQWALSGRPPQPPGRPTDRCLTFDEAEAFVESPADADGETRRHVEQCPYCTKLIAAYRQAIAEGPPGEQPLGGRVLRLVHYVVPAAAAAMVLVAAGVVIYLATRPGVCPGIVRAKVGLTADIEAGFGIKGSPTFTKGESISMPLELDGPGHVMVVKVDPAGQLALLTPQPPSAEMSLAVLGGTVRLGPWCLKDDEGDVKLLVIATSDRPADPSARLEDLRAIYAETGRLVKVAEAIGRWPACVRTVRFTQKLPKPTSRR